MKNKFLVALSFIITTHAIANDTVRNAENSQALEIKTSVTTNNKLDESKFTKLIGTLNKNQLLKYGMLESNAGNIELSIKFLQQAAVKGSSKAVLTMSNVYVNTHHYDQSYVMVNCYALLNIAKLSNDLDVSKSAKQAFNAFDSGLKSQAQQSNANLKIYQQIVSEAKTIEVQLRKLGFGLGSDGTTKSF
jgi:hypothetical protein